MENFGKFVNILKEYNEDFVKINIQKIQEFVDRDWSKQPHGEEARSVARYWKAVLEPKFLGKGEPFKSAAKIGAKAKTYADLKKAIEKCQIDEE